MISDPRFIALVKSLGLLALLVFFRVFLLIWIQDTLLVAWHV